MRDPNGTLTLAKPQPPTTTHHHHHHRPEIEVNKTCRERRGKGTSLPTEHDNQTRTTLITNNIHSVFGSTPQHFVDLLGPPPQKARGKTSRSSHDTKDCRRVYLRTTDPHHSSKLACDLHLISAHTTNDDACTPEETVSV